jgi:hypothetical protein
MKLSHLWTPKLSHGPPSFCCFVRMSHQVTGNPYILLVFSIYLFCFAFSAINAITFVPAYSAAGKSLFASTTTV